MTDFAKESTHWYATDGTPAYTVVGVNGRERATTLRDAKLLNLLPSVTSIIRLAAAPALEKWKRNQVLLAAMTLPKIEGESSDHFVERVETDWQEQGKAAAERGTTIHAAIEKHYRGEYHGDLWTPWIIEATAELSLRCGNQAWKPERSFASPLGYGGKTDLHSDGWIVDVKTKDGDLSATTYDEHVLQLAAYRNGLGIGEAKGGILFVRRDKPAALFCEVKEADLQRGWAMFQALLAYWQAKTGYRP